MLCIVVTLTLFVYTTLYVNISFIEAFVPPFRQLYDRHRCLHTLNLPGPPANWLWGNLPMLWWKAKVLTTHCTMQLSEWTKVGEELNLIQLHLRAEI